MSDKTQALKVTLLVITRFLAAGAALAEEPPATGLTAQAGATQAGAPSGPLLAAEAAPPAVPEPEGAPAVLQEIGRRQTELTILELDLKRAELQKKLRELDNAVPAGAPPFAAGLPAIVMAPAGPRTGAPGGGGPVVSRIHKVGGGLIAVVILADGETRSVRPGGTLEPGLRVVDIRPDAVYVRQGEQPAFALPVFLAGRGGS